MSVELNVSIIYSFGIPIKKIDSYKHALEVRRQILNDFTKKVEHSQSVGAKLEELPSLEKEMTTMEPTLLHLHLDGDFSDRSLLVLENQHRFVDKPVEELTQYKIKAQAKDATIYPDSRLLILAMNTTLNQYGVFCKEDAGFASIPIMEIYDQYEKVNKTNKSLVVSNIPLLFHTKEPIQKGTISLIVHKITLDQNVRLERKIDSTKNVPQNTLIFKQMTNEYYAQFASQLGNFIPVSKGSEEMNCPFYPSQILFSGDSSKLETQMIPLPGFLMFDNLDVSPSFDVNIVKIMVDRDFKLDRSKREDVFRGSFMWFERFMNGTTKARAREMARFMTLYVQSMDYYSDITFSLKERKKLPVENFSEIYVLGDGDCEDSGRGIVRRYYTFLNTTPHLSILYRCLVALDDERENTLYDDEIVRLLDKYQDGTMAERLIKFHKDGKFWSDLTKHVYQTFEDILENLVKITQPIKTKIVKEHKIVHLEGVDPENVTFNYLGGNLEALVFCLILREFHRLGCYYIDTFTLFGVRDSHVQNVPPSKEEEEKEHVKEIVPKKRTLEEMETEKTSGAHAAVIFWPEMVFEKSSSNFDSQFVLSMSNFYQDWRTDYGYPVEGSEYFPNIDDKMFEVLILEGTGMLEPSSMKDPYPKTRKMLYGLPLFAVAKKELIPEHYDSPFYQSVILGVSKRILDTLRIGTINISKKIDMNTVISNPKSVYSQCVVSGLQVNERVLSSMGNDATSPTHTLENVSSTPKEALQRYADSFTIGGASSGQLYSKGTPFQNIASGDQGIQLIPFGFTRKKAHERLTQLKSGLESKQDSKQVLALIRDANPSLKTKSCEEIIQYINYEISHIGNEFMLGDQYSMAEFNNQTMEMMKNITKQAPMVPKITSSLVPDPIILISNNNTEYSHLRILATKFPASKVVKEKCLRFSALLRREQIGDEVAAAKITSQIAEYNGTNGDFIKGIDYCIEKYTNTSFSIRIDFFVSNLDQ